MDARAELIKVVEDVRRRWRTKLALRGALFVLAGAVLTLVLASSGLQAFAFAPNAVIGFRIAVFAAFAVLIAIWLFKPLRRKVTDEQVALYIEEQDPTLREELVSAIEMSKAVEANQPSVSRALVDRLVRDAIAKVRAIDNGKTIGREVIRRLAMGLGAGVVATTLLLIYGPEFLRDGVSALLIITRDAEAAAPFHIGVEPGNARVPRGSDQTIKARLSGFASNDVQLFFRDDESKEYDSIPLAASPTGDSFTGILFDLKNPVRYYVKSNGVTSPIYTMTTVALPAVDEMELEYVFPSYTGLPNQIVKPGGDVAALRGTEVRLKIKPTMATPGGAVSVDPSGANALTTQADGTLKGSFKVDKDGFYHVELTGPDGEKVKASPEYTVDVLTDGSPRVSFSKPGRDTHAMSLDELFLQIKADDDYGVRGLQLFYSVNGGAEKSINLYSPGGKGLSEVTAGHTLYLEELGVKPGDSVSYYAKATDSDIVSGPKFGTSDIYFVEIDPFNRNFRQAQSQQQMQGQGQGQQGQQRGSLAAQQKEIIAATFNTERDRATMSADKFKEALVVIRLQQDKLRGQVGELVAQMMERLQGNDEFKKIADLLVKSIDPMKAAETHLDALKPKDALAPEQKAFQLLQEAEQKYDLTVGRQQQQGGGGGGGGGEQAMSEDLADLFQSQLDKQANQYETQQRAQAEQQAQQDQQVDEVAEKLKELARRQQQEVERQRRAQQQGNRATQGGQSQRELADEMEKMARQLQQLSREQQREQQQREDLNKAAQQMQQAANQMRQAAANGQSDGGAQGQNALQQMQEAARQLQQAQQSRPQRDLNAAQQQADKLVQQQKEVADKAAGLPNAGQNRQQQAQQLAEEKARMTQGVNDLQQTLDKLATDTRATDRDTSRRVQEAATALRDQRVRDKIDYTRNTLQNQQQTQQQFETEIAKNLEDVQRRIGAARNAQQGTQQQNGLQQAANQASDLLRNMQSMRDRMQQQGQQGDQQGQQGDGKQSQDGKQGQQGDGKQGDGKQGDGKQGLQGQDGKQGQGKQGEGKQGQGDGKQGEGKQGQGKDGQGKDGQGKEGQGKEGQGKEGQGKEGQGKQGDGKGQGEGQGQGQGRDGKGQQGQQRGDGKQGGLQNGPIERGGGGGDARATGQYQQGQARQFANEAQQALADASNLRRALADAGATKEDQAALDQVLNNLRQLGQQNAYNDPEATQELAARAMDKLQTLEFNLRKKVEKSNQLFLNGSDQVPPAFRGSVEEYYRSLAKKGGGGSTPPAAAPAPKPPVIKK